MLLGREPDSVLALYSAWHWGSNLLEQHKYSSNGTFLKLPLCQPAVEARRLLPTLLLSFFLSLGGGVTHFMQCSFHAN